MKLTSQFESRRKCRLWIERHWPNRHFINFGAPANSGGVEWAKERSDVFYDSTARRWWFKEQKLAMEFKLKFVGKI